MFEQTKPPERSDHLRGQGATKTVAIVCGECPDGFMFINKSDFNPKEHEIFEGEVPAHEEEAPAAAPPVRKRRSKKSDAE